MNSAKNEIGYFPQMPICDKHLQSDLSSDFTLPDYKSEIRRLLCVKARTIVPSEYFLNANAQLECDVNYNILYLGADGELYSLDLCDRCAFKLPLDFGSHAVNPDEITILSEAKVENVNAKVLGPRKLNLKSKVSLHALCLTPEFYNPNIVGSHNKGGIETLILTTPIANIKKCASEPEIISDLITLDKAGENTRVIDMQSSVSISECSASSGQINVRGEVIMKVLYCNDLQNSIPISHTRKIPFTKAIECDGVNNTYECSCFGATTEPQIEVTDDGISIGCALNIYARAQKNDEVYYIADAYSTEKEGVPSYMDVKLLSSLRSSNGNLTQNEVVSLENLSISSDSKIIDVCANINTDEVCLEHNHISIKGKCNYQIIYYLDGEYACKDYSAPFKYEIDCKNNKNTCKDIKWWAQVGVSSTKARMDHEKIFIDSELGFDIFALEEGNINLISELILGQTRNEKDGELLLCYPERDATLWNVAKQYGKPLSKIKKRNSIPENETAVKRRFLVV